MSGEAGRLVTGVEEVCQNLDRVTDGIYRAAVEAADEIAHLLADYAKGHHAWRPRTGATDASTKAGITEASRELVAIALSAGMDYDIYLEFARDGRWAWLWPAVEACRADIMRTFERRLRAAVGAQ